MDTVPLILSTILQAAAAGWALRLAWTVRTTAWLALSLAILLMASRRGYTLYNALVLDQPISMGAESIALTISLLMLFGLWYLARSTTSDTDTTARDDDASARQLLVPKRLTRAALMLGALSIAGSGMVGFLAYHTSRDTALRTLFDHNLNLARSFAQHTEIAAVSTPPAQLLEGLTALWQRSGKHYPGSYLCVVDRTSRLTLHTAYPETVGRYVGDNKLELSGDTGPNTLGGLFDVKQDWVGYYRSSRGQRQVAAFAYVKAIDSFISIHIPADSVHAEIQSTVLPWVGGFLLVTALLLPLALGLLHWAYSSTSRAEIRARRLIEGRERQQAAVAELGQHALTDMDLHTLMDRAVELVAGTLRAEYCKVLELLADGKALLLRAGEGWKEGLVGQAIVDAGMNSQAGYTLASNDPVVVKNLRTETRFNGPALLHDHGVVSGMSVIIHGTKQPFGVLGVHTVQRRIFTKDDVNFLQTVANVLAEAIERKRAEEALLESEAGFKALAEESPNMIFINRGGRIVYANKKCEEQMGYTREEYYAEDFDFMTLIAPESKDLVKENFRKHQQGEEVPPYEYNILTKDGRELSTIHATKLIDFQGDTATLGIVTDITAHKKAEKERRQQQEGLIKLDGWIRKLMAAAGQPRDFHDLVCAGIRDLANADLSALPLIDESGKTFTYVAAAGPKAEWVMGKTLPIQGGGLCGWVAEHGRALCIPSLRDDPRVIQELAQSLDVTTGLLIPLVLEDKVIGGLSAFRKGEPFDELEEQILNLYGQRVAIALANSRLLATLEQRVTNRTAELATINQELEAFSYSVSHDLRSPLRGIDGFSQALLEEYPDKLDDTGKDYLHRVRNASQRMGELIDDLLALSRVTRQEMRREPVELSALAHKIAAQLQENQADRPVEFAVQDGLITQGDSHLLRIVLEHLLGNAWKFTSKEPKARIEFGYTDNSGEGAYFVRDDGVGFDMKYANKLFGAFQRLHSSKEFEGTGIGLATVQRILHRHGGRVWAEGKVGKGATFYFSLG